MTALVQCLEFAGCDVTHVNNLAHEVQRLAGQRVIEVDGHLVIRNLHDLRIDDLPVHGVHRHDSTFVHTLRVELVIAVVEQLLVERHDAVIVILAVCLIRGDDKVKRVIHILAEHRRLKHRQHHSFAMAINKRTLQCSGLHHFLLAIFAYHKHLVDEGGNFLVFNLHIRKF